MEIIDLEAGAPPNITLAAMTAWDRVGRCAIAGMPYDDDIDQGEADEITPMFREHLADELARVLGRSIEPDQIEMAWVSEQQARDKWATLGALPGTEVPWEPGTCMAIARYPMTREHSG